LSYIDNKVGLQEKNLQVQFTIKNLRRTTGW